jgi:hypothetical protein
MVAQTNAFIPGAGHAQRCAAASPRENHSQRRCAPVASLRRCEKKTSLSHRIAVPPRAISLRSRRAFAPLREKNIFVPSHRRAAESYIFALPSRLCAVARKNTFVPSHRRAAASYIFALPSRLCAVARKNVFAPSRRGGKNICRIARYATDITIK